MCNCDPLKLCSQTCNGQILRLPWSSQLKPYEARPITTYSCNNSQIQSQFTDTYSGVNMINTMNAFITALTTTHQIYFVTTDINLGLVSGVYDVSNIAMIGVTGGVVLPLNSNITYVGTTNNSIIFIKGGRGYDPSYQYYVVKKKVILVFPQNVNNGLFENVTSCVFGFLRFEAMGGIVIGTNPGISFSVPLVAAAVAPPLTKIVNPDARKAKNGKCNNFTKG